MKESVDNVIAYAHMLLITSVNQLCQITNDRNKLQMKERDIINKSLILRIEEEKKKIKTEEKIGSLIFFSISFITFYIYRRNNSIEQFAFLWYVIATLGIATLIRISMLKSGVKRLEELLDK